MANFGLVIDGGYTPTTFDEYIKPYQIYGEAYDKRAKELEEISDNIADLDPYISSTLDSDTRKEYDDYMSSLNSLYDDLNNNGLSIPFRDKSLLLRRNYSKLKPLKELIKKREQFSLEQRNLALKYPNIRFDNDFSNMSLDTLRKNPSMGYHALIGDDIATQTSNLVKEVVKGILNKPEYKEKILNGNYILPLLREGYPLEQALLAISNDPAAPNELKKVREDIHSALVNNPAYNREWVDQQINRGMYSAIGKVAYGDPEPSPDFRMALKQASSGGGGTARKSTASSESPIEYRGMDGRIYVDTGNKEYVLDKERNEWVTRKSTKTKPASNSDTATAKGVSFVVKGDDSYTSYNNSDNINKEYEGKKSGLIVSGVDSSGHLKSGEYVSGATLDTLEKITGIPRESNGDSKESYSDYFEKISNWYDITLAAPEEGWFRDGPIDIILKNKYSGRKVQVDGMGNNSQSTGQVTGGGNNVEGNNNQLPGGEDGI